MFFISGHGRSRGETPPDSRMTDVDNSEEDFDSGHPDMMAVVVSSILDTQ
jgi:hypothetical protein